MSIPLNDETFFGTISNTPGPLLVVFMSTFCGPSHAMFGLLDHLIDTQEVPLEYAEVDVENCPLLTRQYQVKGTPTLVFFRDGVPLGSRIGTMSWDDLVDFIDDMMEREKPA